MATRQKPKDKLLNWAELRFSIIGPLLAVGPDDRETLDKEFERLAKGIYRHPRKDEVITFGISTIERWYYKAVNGDDPLQALGRKGREDRGKSRSLKIPLLDALQQQYRVYPHWSYQLHADNLVALVEEKPELGEAPSYSTVRRVMRRKGWTKKKKGKLTRGQIRAVERLEQREVRSYESSYVNALWHLDFHQGSLRIVNSGGEWETPMALCILDDRSRLCCHIQWYLHEDAECLIHGLSQAIYKRGLPRSLMTDNGGAMIAEETENGLLTLGIHHERTLAYSPYQNGKQESFWGQLEGRFLAMLTRVESPNLDDLNKATQAWIELEYNRSKHSEIGTTPLDRYIAGPDVSRLSPESQDLLFAFTRKINRQQRRSDGTAPIDGVRFEVPSRFRHFPRLYLRYRSWDLTHAYLVDSQGQVLLAVIKPQDKTKNASGVRRFVGEPGNQPLENLSDSQPIIPPLMRKYLAAYASSGLPAAFIPKDEEQEHEHEES